MKATELMIGDWVYNAYHQKNIQWSYGEMFCPNGNPVIGKDLEPIPLTAEILWKNCPDPDIVEWYPDKSKTVYHIHIESLDITIDGFVKYIHELQRALRLCGLDELADNFKV